MVTECTVESLNEVLDCLRKNKVYYLKIEKINNSLLMNYSLVDDLNKDLQESISNRLNNSIKITFDIIDKVSTLKKIIAKFNISDIIGYSLKYECKPEGDNPTVSFSSMFSNSITNDSLDVKEDEPVHINWDNVFSDKLDNVIPGLYSKKSAKKYVPITYKELVEIIKEQEA